MLEPVFPDSLQNVQLFDRNRLDKVWLDGIKWTCVHLTLVKG